MFEHRSAQCPLAVPCEPPAQRQSSDVFELVPGRGNGVLRLRLDDNSLSNYDQGQGQGRGQAHGVEGSARASGGAAQRRK